jgi:hypothetical protein
VAHGTLAQYLVDFLPLGPASRVFAAREGSIPNWPFVAFAVDFRDNKPQAGRALRQADHN